MASFPSPSTFTGARWTIEMGKRCLPKRVIETNSPIVCWHCHWLGSRSTKTICQNLCIDSDSGRLTILKETARSQERLVLRATNTHQTISRWLLFAKNCESSQTNRLNRLYYLQFLIFFQLKFVWEKLKMQVTSVSADFATTNGDRSTELIESFLLVYRYLDFDNG